MKKCINSTDNIDLMTYDSDYKKLDEISEKIDELLTLLENFGQITSVDIHLCYEADNLYDKLDLFGESLYREMTKLDNKRHLERKVGDYKL